MSNRRQFIQLAAASAAGVGLVESSQAAGPRYVIPPMEIPSLPIEGSKERFPVRRIYCMGLNYHDHIQEGNMQEAAKTFPDFYFQKSNNMIIQNNATIRYPVARDTSEPQPTEIYRPQPPPVVSPRPTTPPPPPPPTAPEWTPTPLSAPPPKNSNAVWWILGGLAALFIVGIGVVVLIVALASLGSNTNTTNVNANANARRSRWLLSSNIRSGTPA